VSQAQTSHDLARSVQGSLFDFVAALEPVLALSVFDLHPAARSNHNPRSFPSQNRSRELARARLRKNEMEERGARAKRENEFCFLVTRLGNSAREIKQRLLHPTGSAACFWLISNTPYEAEDGVVDKRVAIRARNYHIIDGNLYRKGVCAPLLKCISVTEGKQLLHEIHSGMCSHHLGTRALVQKAFRQGFYWPSAVADAHDIVRLCLECQRHAPYSKFTSNEVQLIPPVWPFARWGIDIVGPLPTAPEITPTSCWQ
jgi:hypothetical protein